MPLSQVKANTFVTLLEWGNRMETADPNPESFKVVGRCKGLHLRSSQLSPLMVLNWFSFGGKLKAYNIWKPFTTGNQRGIEIVLYEGLQGSEFSLEWDIFRFPIY